MYHKSAHSSISHTDAHDRLDDISTHHKPPFSSNHKCFQAFSQHGGAFRHGLHGDPRLRRQDNSGRAELAAIDNEAVSGFFEQRSWDFTLCRSKTQRKNTAFNASFDSKGLSTDTDGTTETDNTW